MRSASWIVQHEPDIKSELIGKGLATAPPVNQFRTEAMKYKDMNIHERINLKSWYKQYFAFPWAYVSIRDAERGGYRHYEEWMRQPIR